MLMYLTLTPTLPLSLISTEGETDAVLQAILGAEGCVHAEVGRWHITVCSLRRRYPHFVPSINFLPNFARK